MFLKQVMSRYFSSSHNSSQSFNNFINLFLTCSSIRLSILIFLLFLKKYAGTQQGMENSRMYNEMVVLKLVESMTKMITNPPDVFRNEILTHFRERGESMCNRIKSWMDMSTATNPTTAQQPEFSLVPASRGFCLKLVGLLENFRNKLDAMNQLILLPP